MSGSEDYRCRICLATEVNELISVFCLTSTQNMLISHMTLACTGVPISTRDKMPQHICDECLGNLDTAYACWKQSRLAWGQYKRSPTLRLTEEDYCCRICLKAEVDELISLFCLCDSQLLKISEIIERFAGMTVDPKDRRPQYVCNDCLADLNVGYEFRKLCRASTEKLRLEVGLKPLEVARVRPESPDNNIPPGYDTDEDWANQGDSSSDDEPLIRSNSALKSPMKRQQDQKKVASKTGKMVSKTVIKKPIEKVQKSVTQTKSIEIPPSPTRKQPSKASINRKSSPQKDNKVITFSDPAILRKLADKVIAAGKTGKLTSNTIVVDENFTQWKASAFQKQINSGNITLKAVPLNAVSLTTNESKSPSAKTKLLKPSLGKHSTMLALKKLKTTEDHYKKKYIRCQLLSMYCLSCGKDYDKIGSIATRCVQCQLPFANYSQLIPFYDKRTNMLKSYCCKLCGFLSVPIGTMESHITSQHLPQTTSKPTVIRPIAMYETQMDLPMEATEDDDFDPLDMKCEPETDTELVESVETMDQMSTRLERKRSSSGAGASQSIQPTAAKQRKSGLTVGLNKTTDTCAESEDEITDSPYDSRFEIQEDCESYTLLELNGLVCCGCLTIHSTQQHLEEHRQLYHHPEDDNNDDGEDENTCPFCTTMCDTEQELINHRNLSARKTFFYCKLCPAVLWHSDDFDEHFNNEHVLEFQQSAGVEEDESETMESIIEEPFKLTSMNKNIFDILSESERYILLGLKGHLCCGCGMVYRSKNLLLKHCKEHQPAEESFPSNPFSCNICQKRFELESDLEQHELHRVKRLYYSCGSCDYQLVEDAIDYKTHLEQYHAKRKITVTAKMMAMPRNLLVSKAGCDWKQYYG